MSSHLDSEDNEVYSVVVDDSSRSIPELEYGAKHRRRESISVGRQEADRQEEGSVWRVKVIRRGVDIWEV